MDGSPLVLNQYREGSSYKDQLGRLYHFPDRYLKSFHDLPVWFVYYEPREGGKQVYFGAGRIDVIYGDSEDVGHHYAEIGCYFPFRVPVDFYAGPKGESWERPKTMRNSVRRIIPDLYAAITSAGALDPGHAEAAPEAELVLDSMIHALERDPGPGRRSPYILRKVRRVLECYERPNAVTNHVKSVRGDACQLCGQRGFVKRDGKRYCEIHHLFHLADDPPTNALSPEYVVVLCANCHRRMHYASISTPMRVDDGWAVLVDGQPVTFLTRELRV